MEIINLANQYENIYVSGDIHGEFKTFLHHIFVRNGITNATVIIAGDCGIGFDKPQYYEDLYNRHLSKKLKAANVLLLLVRGNHDDPRYFNEKLIDFPLMKTITDYSIVHTIRHNILCVGGAVSVDRYPRQSQMILDRLLGKDKLPVHWTDETFVYNDRALHSIFQSDIKIDAVVTHTAPGFCNTTDKQKIIHYLAIDETLSSDLKKEAYDLTRLYNSLKRNNHPIRNWYFGHFHNSDTIVYENTCFHMLDINETAQIK